MFSPFIKWAAITSVVLGLGTIGAARSGELGLVAAEGPSTPPAPVNATDPNDILKRGEYLTRAGDCISCHTKPGGEKFAGGLKLDTPVGPIYSPNITPDRDTGIGGWSDDDFYRALHQGIGKGGRYLYPAFPFPWYTNVTRADALAIKAYLNAQKAVHSPNKPPGFAFPFDIRESLISWRALFFKEGKPGETAPSPDDALARGRYLVEGLGHCGECHNRRMELGASDWSGKFEGGEIEGWYSANITSDNRQGLGTWSTDQIATFLKSGLAPHNGVALGPMQETIEDSLSHLTDVDLHDMAVYLKSIKPKQTYSNSEGGYAKAGAPGETLYQNHCASCHGLDGEGVKGRVPSLRKNGAVIARGSQDIVRVILGGLTPQSGLGPMPAIGADLSDAEVADIADYVRNNFGNTAPASTTTAEVAELRKNVRTPMLALDRGDCDKPQTPQVKALVSDGALADLAKVDKVKLLPSIDAIVEKLSPSNDKDADAYVRDLSGGYCMALFDVAHPSEPERAIRLGRFSALAYSRIMSRRSP